MTTSTAARRQHNTPLYTRSNRVLLVWYITRRYEYILLGASSFARLFDLEIIAALDRLGGLGGVW
ncbi:hypothetical protein [Acidithiobacillus ferriphilus]|uniref:hypothetical protein n=1 Tax=Acidithiobacillus ferriphilus TaxID=1689834 RepID=UPI00232D3326|nr:hypothetical protein [Acidithiobacillus ferriphilus]WCE92715.1 hypothetical protein PJU76_07015 [Acidithiobacillus ferriphilus]